MTVLPYKQVLLKYPTLSEQDALDAYEQEYAQHVEKEDPHKPGDFGGLVLPQQ